MPVPAEPKLYYIVHVDRLESIVADGFLWCDSEVVRRASGGNDDRDGQHQAASP